jgi:hypothetical protein
MTDKTPAQPKAALTDFDHWLAEEFSRGTSAGFTVFAILLKIGTKDVDPLCSTYMHVIGGETDWGEITTLFAGSGVKWDGAVFFPKRDHRTNGPLDNPTARLFLMDQEAKITADRLAINEGHFFDAFGRRMMVEEVPAS